MIKQPLFGQDSSPHKTSTYLSAIITAAFWLILTITGAFIKIKPAAPKYKEVQIVLSSKSEASEQHSAAPEQQPAVEQSVVVEQQSVVPEQQSVVPEALEGPAPKATPAPAKPKTQTQAKPAPKTTPKPTPKATEPSKKVNFDDFQYARDYSEGVDFNQNQTKAKDFDWSRFDNTTSEPEPQVSQKVTTVSGSSGMQGSAASSAPQQTQSKSSSQNKQQNQTQSASSATSNMLSNIRNTQYSTSSGSNTKSITDAKTTKSADGTLSMAMTDGTTRVLIEPIPPVIYLSEAAAATIDSTRTVSIEFQVLASGNVPRAQIKITPESILPQTVRNEIYDQLSSWLFESSSSSARATFEYTIQKR